jgi:hypothetical protein
VGSAEVFGEWRPLATGSLYDSLVARYDMVDEGLHPIQDTAWVTTADRMSR